MCLTNTFVMEMNNELSQRGLIKIIVLQERKVLKRYERELADYVFEKKKN